MQLIVGKRGYRLLPLLALALVLGLMVVSGANAAKPPNYAADLDQCRNGSAASPNDCKDFGGNTGWVNGNAGASNAHYAEGESISYRAYVSGRPELLTTDISTGNGGTI